MTTLQNENLTASVNLDTTIEFRVSRVGSPRRRLRLVGSRYTIGSGADCSVRLDDVSVRPTHAVLTRDCDRVLLRAYGAAILVNGRQVTEAQLCVTDHFSIGAYEFELTLGPVRPSKPHETKSPPQAERIERAAAEKTYLPETKVVPRRRLSFANAMQLVTQETDTSTETVSESAVETTATTAAVDLKPGQDVNLEVATDATRRSAIPDGSGVEQSSLPQTEVGWPETSGTSDDSADELVSAAPHGMIDDVDTTADPAISLAGLGRPANAELFEQHRAILANERRWQERSQRQLEKFRQREQRSAVQIEVLRSSQEAAERRARNAEEAVQALKTQVAELSGRFASMAATVMPGLEQRIEQQQQESVVASRQYQSLVDGLRSRLDFLQSALTDIQAETEEIRQQTVANREDQQEFAANTDSLEQTLQKLSDDYQAARADADIQTEQLRQSLYQSSLKLADLTGQLEDTRQNSHGLGALVQQLRSSLQNAKSEAQRFATVEQIEEAIRLLKANDQRISQLTEEYDSHSNLVQQECDALRQRLEETEQIANSAAASATQALNEALEQRQALEGLAASQSESTEPAVTQEWTSGSSGSTETRQGFVSHVSDETTDAALDERVVDDQNLPASEDSGQVAWIDSDDQDVDAGDTPLGEVQVSELEPHEIEDSLEEEASADSSPEVESEETTSESEEPFNHNASSASVSLSQFHLPLEIAPPASTRQDSAISNFSAEAYADAQPDEESYDATYQFDRDQLSAFRSNAGQDDDVDAAESPVGIEETDDVYNATAFVDVRPQIEAENAGDGPSDSVGKSGPRSAAEILASLGISVDDADDDGSIEENASVGAREVEYDDSSGKWGNSAESMSSSWVEPEDTFKSTQEPGPVLSRQAESSPASVEDHSSEEEEDSIEAYMNRLLRRVQGQSESESISSEPKAFTVEPKRPSAAEPSQFQREEQEEPTKPTDSSSFGDSGYMPRSKPPEKTGNLAAMRELANTAARSAIATSARKKMSNEVLFKYGLFGMGILAGGAVMLGTKFEFGPWMIIGICCFGLAVFFLLEGYNLSKQLAESAASTAEQEAADSAV